MHDYRMVQWSSLVLVVPGKREGPLFQNWEAVCLFDSLCEDPANRIFRKNVKLLYKYSPTVGYCTRIIVE